MLNKSGIRTFPHLGAPLLNIFHAQGAGVNARAGPAGRGRAGYREAMAPRLLTERLVLRAWTIDDAPAALGAYGDSGVARWLVPAMDQVHDEAAMRLVLQQWVAENARMQAPAGRWAVELREDGRLIGGATLLPLPPDDEFEVGWQLNPQVWGHGYAAETGLALARWAFEQGIEQVIALVRPANARAMAMVRRLGMEWVGETEKYHDLRLQQFRLRPADIGAPAW
jgi:RimJ/RimL family protein N-acetyltransferase